MEITNDRPWFNALRCLFGQEGVDWEYMETDPNWWAVRFIALNIHN